MGRRAAWRLTESQTDGFHSDQEEPSAAQERKPTAGPRPGDHPTAATTLALGQQVDLDLGPSPLLACRLYRRGFFTFVCGHDWSVLRLQPRFAIEEAKLTAEALRSNGSH